MLRLAVLISGNGSNLQALIEAFGSNQSAARIVLVVSNRRKAYGLERAKKAQITTLYHPLGPYKRQGQSRITYDLDLAHALKAAGVDLLILAGWMHILSAEFLGAFEGPVLNLHPALPGEFAGIQAIERAFAAFERGEITQTGVMVHRVIPEVDAGSVILSEKIQISQRDSLDSLRERIHSLEHRLIVQATAQVVDEMIASKG